MTVGPWKVQCSATSKRSGTQCTRWAMKGQATCHMHGAKTTAAVMKGQERLSSVEERVKELGDRAVSTLESLLDDPGVKPEVRARAAETILDRIIGKKIETKDTTHSDEKDLDAEILEELGELPEPAEEIA